MPLVLLIGGARSGKSRLAVRMAEEQSAPVTFIASAEAGDDEMAAKIDRHRRERPDGWQTVEAPLRLREAIVAVAGERCLIVDCLTVWTANRLAAGGARESAAGGAAEITAGGAGETLTYAAEAAATAAARPGLTIAVTNEVGLGVHPYSSLGREFRDLLGSVNLAWAELAEWAYLVVAGRALALEDARTLTLEAGRALTLDSGPAPLPEEIA